VDTADALPTVSCGQVARSLWCVIVDPATGDEVADGTIGEIWLQGNNIGRGYWARPEETAKALEGGWFHTGDAGYLDDEGYLFLVDRKKDMIISGGENIYSREVENALLEHPGVAEAAVVGVPDAHWGEAVKAIVVLRPGSQLTEAQLIAHARGLIAAYKCPKSVAFVDALPLLATGKVDKRGLRERYDHQAQ